MRTVAAHDFLGGRDASTVDKAMQVAEGLEGKIDGGLRVGCAGYVGEGEAGGGAELGSDFFTSGMIEVGENDGGAFGNEKTGRGCAES